MEKFFDAIRIGNAEKIGLMIKLGQDVNVKNSDGCSPLNVAIRERNLKIIKTLISAGADVNAVEVDSGGYFGESLSLLHFAIRDSCGETEIINMLVSAGANVNAVSVNKFKEIPSERYGSSALHYAADEDPRITSILISAGANVNVVNNKGNSVLHEAVLCGNRNGGNAEIIYMLVSAGADVTAKNKEGKTALELMS